MGEPYQLNGAGDTLTWQNESDRIFEADRNFRGDFYFRSDPFIFETYSEAGSYLFAALLGHLKHVRVYPSHDVLFNDQKEPIPAMQLPPLEFIFHDVVHAHPSVNRVVRGEPTVRAKSSKHGVALTSRESYLLLESQDAVTLAKAIVRLSPNLLPLDFVYRYGAQADVAQKLPDRTLASQLRLK